MRINRRELLTSAGAAAGSLALGPAFIRQALAAPARAGESPYGALAAPDANGLMLPPGFSSRKIAQGLSPVGSSGYSWPIFSDGQATYRTKDGGWILVTNSESVAASGAGSSAVRFGPDGQISDAYRILGGTNVNCAGGPTPWGTWLSCEEGDSGLVWECDPAGVLEAESRPALGAFKHEAAAVDPVGGHVYLTEDNSPAGFYRFSPENYPDLSAGILEVAVVRPNGKIRWVQVPDPTTAQTGTRTALQVPEATPFQNAEGIWYARGVCYFTTKTDKKVWAYDIETNKIEILFDRTLAADSSLDAVDNVTVSAADEVLVCEDGGNMEIGLITPDGRISPLLRFNAPEHDNSEVCGVVFDPTGTRLYCTSQRAFGAFGAVYEVSGPFRKATKGVPSHIAFGPPAGEVRPSGPLSPGADKAAPRPKAKLKKKVARQGLMRRGLELELLVDEASTVAVTLDSSDLASDPGRGGSTKRPRRIVLARERARIERDAGKTVLRLRPEGRGRQMLAKHREALDARVLISVVDGAGNEKALAKRVKIGAAG